MGFEYDAYKELTLQIGEADAISEVCTIAIRHLSAELHDARSKGGNLLEAFSRKYKIGPEFKEGKEISFAIVDHYSLTRNKLMHKLNDSTQILAS